MNRVRGDIWWRCHYSCLVSGDTIALFGGDVITPAEHGYYAYHHN